jgi:hypothetical protein
MGVGGGVGAGVGAGGGVGGGVAVDGGVGATTIGETCPATAVREPRVEAGAHPTTRITAKRSAEMRDIYRFVEPAGRAASTGGYIYRVP